MKEMIKDWLFLVNLEGQSGAELAKYFRKIKGYKKIERRGPEEVTYEKKGLLGMADGAVWIGDGSFMVHCDVETRDLIKKGIDELSIYVAIYECLAI